MLKTVNHLTTGCNNIEDVTFPIAGAGPTATHHLYSIYSNYSLAFRYMLFISNKPPYSIVPLFTYQMDYLFYIVPRFVNSTKKRIPCLINYLRQKYRLMFHPVVLVVPVASGSVLLVLRRSGYLLTDSAAVVARSDFVAEQNSY